MNAKIEIKLMEHVDKSLVMLKTTGGTGRLFNWQGSEDSKPYRSGYSRVLFRRSERTRKGSLADIRIIKNSKLVFAGTGLRKSKSK